jgi:hypothetical protein
MTKAGNWEPHVATDANLITGQKPASAHGGANALDQLSAHAVTRKGGGRMCGAIRRVL